uniref:non-ribosomal peptide synthetase n=1 Tax=Oceaniglobus roseus TaxID=1737570 RepID=UPI0012FFEDA2
MTAAALYNRLLTLGLTVAAEDGDIVIDGPTERLDDGLVEEIRAHKAALLDHIAAREIRRRAAPGDSPLSAQQQRLWFLDQLDPGNPAYNIAAAYRLRGAVDVARLQSVLDRIVARHAALRTTFVAARDGPVQRIETGLRVPLEVTDLGGQADRHEAAQALADGHAMWRFDLARGPLLRVSLIRLDADDHVLAVNMHHIISDGWSLGVLMRDVARAYAGLPLAEPTLDYADYAIWQRNAGQGAHEDDLRHWKDRLADVPPLTTLLADNPRPAVQSHRGARVGLALDPGTTGRLRDLTTRRGGSLFMVLLAAMGIVLSRHCRSDDLCIGTPVANRTRPGLDDVIGFFVNMLPMRLAPDHDMPLGDYLEAVRDTVMEAFAHQDLPFDRLVDALGIERQLSHPPLFQTVLTLREAEGAGAALPGLTLEPMEPGRVTAQYDLSIVLAETDEGGLAGALIWAADLFGEARMARLAGHFTRLLHAMAEGEAGTPLRDLSMLGLEEEILLTGGLARGAAREVPRGIALRVAALSRQDPDLPAVVCGDITLTRRQLNDRADALARALQRAGIGVGDVVGVHAAPTAERVVATLAVARAGACLLPLDPGHPAARLQYMVADASAAAIVGRDLPFAVDCPVQDFDAAPGVPDPVTPPAEAPAYVIYTSGSTGRPKGVAVPFRGLENLVAWQERTAGIASGTRVSAMARFGFDGSIFETWPTLAAGGVLVLAPAPAQSDAAQLLAWWADQRLEVSFMPTPLAELAMAQGAFPDGLRWLLTGGDRLRQAPPAGAPFRLVNLYGPTETSVIATAGEVAPGDAHLPIGRPIDNLRTYLLGPDLSPVPLGAVGLLHVAGPAVAQGYIGRADQTAAAFLPDPFGPPGARMYDTGDLARYLPDGRLAYLGRVDGQIGLRGYRIEPGEVERALQEAADGRDALVIADGGRLLGYVKTADGIDPDGVRGAMARLLPDYMVPEDIVALPEWPLTANGKLDRAALPRPEATAAVAEPPRTQTEKRLAAIWEDVLHRPDIGRHDRFFALGGHSLLATQAIARIREGFDVDLPLRIVFEARTLADLAAAIDRAGTGPDALPPLGPRDPATVGDLPLSPAQRRLWFLEQLEPGNPFYTIPASLRLEGALDVEALRATLVALAERHESLRTTFVAVDGAPVQRVSPVADVPLDLVDLSAAPDQVADHVARAARAPFDLATGPLLRASLLRLGADDHLLLFNMHHIVSDGWSMGVMIRDMGAIYAALSQGRPNPLPPLAVQYPDFAVWQNGWLTGERLRRDEDYWRARLGDLPAVPVRLPLDRPRPPAQSHRGATHSFDLDADLGGRLRRLADGRGATLFMVLNAAYAVLLSRMSGQDDIVIGSPVANRRQPALEHLVGFFVNTLVLRHRVDPDRTFEGLLDSVRQTALAAYDHQDLPFEHLVDLLNPARDLGHAPVFQISFALQNMPTQTLDLPGLALRPSGTVATTAKFDLTLTVFEIDGGALHCDLEYATDLFDAASVERMGRDYARLLRAVADDPQAALRDLPLTSADDLARLARWNDTATDGTPPDVVQAIAAVAARQPDATAVFWQDERLGYGALDRAANRLAHALRAAGVGAGTLVGLGTGRGIAHIVAGLAILKAGGAFVMLPMDAPPARLRHILSDTALRHVVGPPDGGWPAEVTVIDPRAEGHPETPPPPVAASAASRAYVVFTSGTTGRPKGSVNTRAGLANLCHWYGAAFDLGPGSVVSAVANIAFDGILPEIWPTLTHGATLVLVPEDTLRDPWLLSDLLAGTGVDTLYLPMGYLDAIARSGFDFPPTLRRVLAGGDRMKGYLLPRESGLELVNVYGPSEVQSISTFETIRADHTGTVSIGRPIPNVRVLVVDGRMTPLPPGAVGEICIAGRGVGEGYLNLPALTAERFVPDPLGPPGARMYRSGDMGRFLPDGRIDFVGRDDGQLKIRGFRIELGEVEAALLDQDGVAEAAVVAAPLAEGDTRLIAYVVPTAPQQTGRTHWESTFQQIYGDEALVAGDPRVDVVGWTDSYTGAPIPPGEMVEWLDRTVETIAALGPRKVLEVGCGTGMILHRIAPLTERYVATDLSQRVLEKLDRSRPARDPRVVLHHAPADDWSPLEGQDFDTVILNSVAQYFPSLDYLERWLDAAVAHVPKGSIFLGDIRNLALAEAFALSVIESRAADDTDIGTLRARLARDLAIEPELLVDPAWFFAQAGRNPRITGVAVLPKRGAAVNELTRFRYDVVLTIDGDRARQPEDWVEFRGFDGIEEALGAAPPRLALRRVPDARTHRAAAMASLLRDLPVQADLSHLRAQVDAMPSAVALDDLAARHGYRLALGLGAGGLNVVFWRDGGPPDWSDLHPRPPRVSPRHGNVPYQPERNAALVESLTGALAARLPSYMVPASLVVLERLPLTANGKLDRRGLPVPGAEARGARPGGGGAGRVAGIWAEVLGLSPDAIGMEDTFFALGGHSLLATQVISRLRAAFGIELPLRALFEHPTLAALVPAIEAAMAAGGGTEDGPKPRAGTGPAPLSFAQQRLWFLDQLAPGDTAYSLPMALRLDGALDARALAAALG